MPGPTELQGFQIEDGSIPLIKLNQSGASIGDAPIWDGTKFSPAPAGGGGSTANALATTGAPVNVSSAAPPTVGQVLTATDATHATWQTPGTGGVTLDGAYDFGGSGAGRTVTVDSGAVQFLGNAADNNNVVEIQKTPAASHSGNGLDVSMGVNATGIGVRVAHAGSGAGVAVAMAATSTSNGITVTMAAGATGFAALFSGAPISVPGFSGAANTERFGAATVADGAGSTAVGHGATSTTFLQATVVGFGAQGLGNHATVFGASAQTAGDGVAFGWSANAASFGGVFGDQSTAGLAGDYVVGSLSTANGGASLAFGGGIVNNATNTVAIGNNISIISAGANSIIIGGDAFATAGTLGPGNVIIGQGATALNAQGLAIGQFSVSNGYSSIGLGWEADAFGNESVSIGGRARTYTIDRLTHVKSARDHTFVSGHLFFEVNNAYFGGGIQCPETTGRFAQSPPNAVINGTGGQTWTTIGEPEALNSSGTAVTAVSGFLVGGTLTPGQTWNVAIGFRNKEADGETLLTPMEPVLILGGDNAIIFGNFGPSFAGDPQIEDIALYMEDTPGSTNLYLNGDAFPTTVTYPLGAGASPFSIPGYLGAVSQVASNTTASAGHGWSIGFAGGDSDDAALPGGDIDFSTNRTGAAHTLTLAGYFNAADGTFSVPGDGSQSERFGLNAIAQQPDSVAVGFNAQTISGEGENRGIAIGSGAVVNGGGSIGIGFNANVGNADVVIGTNLNVQSSSTILISTSTDTIPGTLGGVIAIQDGAQAAWGGNGDLTVIGRFNDFSALTGNDILSIGRSNVFTGVGDMIGIGRSIVLGASGTDTDLIAIGNGASATGQNAIAIGSAATAATNEVSFNNGDFLFKVGTATGVQFGASNTVKMGWWGATPVAQLTVSGSRADPEQALASLLTQLATYGIIVDTTTA